MRLVPAFAGIRGPLAAGTRTVLTELIEDLPLPEEPAQDRRLGTVVGRYKLTAVLGRGGSGTVYLAERADNEYSARVALKIVAQSHGHDLGMRFRLERQILASLNHPNIARLLDAGEASDGQPYLVMEYIEGVPVNRYCDEQKLDVRARLELFTEICGAVSYAHQNLVVHRDLKPQNVLVTNDGTVKLLDFGIAKLLESRSATVALTRMNDRVLTVEYASPEQIRGDTITTATDVYSLGVVLYELLVGAPPFQIPPDAGQLELERLVCLTDPQKPSVTIAKAIGGVLPSHDFPGVAALAAVRSTTPEKLQKQLLGDIDSIVLRTLRKEAQTRYASVEQFVTDVRAYLDNEPVSARQGNWVYYAQRFVRRHTGAVVGASAFVVGLIGVAIAMSIQAHRIAIERDQAQRVSDFMTDVFAAADPFVHQGKEMTASQLLDTASEKLTNDLQADPEVRARLLLAIGRSLLRQTQGPKAVKPLEEALKIQRSLDSPDMGRSVLLLRSLGTSYRDAARFDDAERVYREAFELTAKKPWDTSKDRESLLVDMARLEIWRSRPEKAESFLENALELARRIDGPQSLEVASVLTDLANARNWQDDLAGAERYEREAVAIYHASASPTHPDRVNADYDLADLLVIEGGHADEAATLLQGVLEQQKQLYGSGNSRLGATLTTLAKARAQQGREADAEALMHEAMDLYRVLGAGEAHRLVYTRTSLGNLLIGRHAFVEAEAELRTAFDASLKALGADHQYTASSEYFLGEALLGLGRFDEAERVLTSSAARWQRAGAPAWRSTRARCALGELLIRRGDVDPGKKLLASSYAALASDPKAEKKVVAEAHARILKFYPEYRSSE
jgi:tetratricopeptide (TPR) repeat protein